MMTKLCRKQVVDRLVDIPDVNRRVNVFRDWTVRLGQRQHNWGTQATWHISRELHYYTPRRHYLLVKVSRVEDLRWTASWLLPFRVGVPREEHIFQHGWRPDA